MTKRYLFFLAVSSFILTIIWIASNAYHSYVTSTIDPVLSLQIQELPEDFDNQTISDLKKRSRVEPIDPVTAQVEEETQTNDEEDELIEETVIPNEESIDIPESPQEEENIQG